MAYKNTSPPPSNTSKMPEINRKKPITTCMRNKIPAI
jgi:hypothetical protein